MADDEHDRRPRTPRAGGETIDATFRNGSLTAISVVVGFSLSFLTRWAGLPGPWLTVDLVALPAIILGIVFQVAALAGLLSTRSLLLRNYNRGVRLFLIGLVLVATGVALAIAGDLVGYGKRLLGE
jgi:riboflavin transporter FmnP